MLVVSALVCVSFLCVVIVQGLPVHQTYAPVAAVLPGPEEILEAGQGNLGKQTRSKLTQVNGTIRNIHCSEGYYTYGQALRCCNCPAGTHVAEHCKEDSKSSKCEDCTEGEDYTEFPNGVDKCLPCRSCRTDEEMVSRCTRLNDTVCRCKAGRYCLPRQTCEMCQKCTTKCSEGLVVKFKCSSTSDTVCGSVESSALSGGAIAAIVVTPVLLIAGCLIVFICRRRMGLEDRFPNRGSGAMEEEDHPENNDSLAGSGGEVENMINEARNETEGLLPNGLSTPAGYHAETSMSNPSVVQHDPSDSLNSTENAQPFQMVEEFLDSEGLRQTFSLFVNAVPIGRWKEFMRRLQLTENQIVEAQHNNVMDVKEGHYQMLQTWLQKAGNKASVKTLLLTLSEMDLVTAANDISLSLLNNGTTEH
ncbi:tumor necrosis factor receptor superfamily member 10A-like isoform X2 [Scyliorhinus canicula]|uniref:tumor necrosis factor receptor superfamily member 10A-like isoform X2 n=1 Tax=Scyliorhinus canicula TaxID=7830 RepID=UPI0018F42989|nr:tumor necrosis factor receptor superfamily member 10A-like isoform X2 [Scyliorhinus canicula]